MSLVQLAKENKLPLHQNLDFETLQWIKDNEPQEMKDKDLALVARNVDIESISRLTPSSTWFTSSEKVNSLHGVRHLMRVATYAWLLSKEIDKTQKNSLLVAAVLHDVRRLDDKADEGHAGRAAEWYGENKEDVLSRFKIGTVDDKIIVELIKLHELNSNVSEFRKLLDILKTSDALDRYIQPKQKWWPDDRYLNLKPSLEVKAFAFNLSVKSEEKYLAGSISDEAVLLSLKELQS